MNDGVVNVLAWCCRASLGQQLLHLGVLVFKARSPKGMPLDSRVAFEIPALRKEFCR
jgi:hypothetical protein